MHLVEEGKEEFSNFNQFESFYIAKIKVNLFCDLAPQKTSFFAFEALSKIISCIFSTCIAYSFHICLNVLSCRPQGFFSGSLSFS